MVAPRPLDEVLAGLVHLGGVAVHAAEELAFYDVRDGRGAGVAVGRGGSVAVVVELEGDDGFPRAVGEFVVVVDFDLLSWAGAGLGVSWWFGFGVEGLTLWLVRTW